MNDRHSGQPGGVWASGLRKRIRQGTGALMYEKSVVILSQLLVVPALAGTWGASTYGVWVMLIAGPQFLAFSDLGLSVVAGVRLTEAVVAGDEAAARRAFHTALATMTALVTMFVAIGLSTIALIPQEVFYGYSGIAANELIGSIIALMLYGCLLLACGSLAVGLKAHGHLHVSVYWYATTILAEAIATIAAALSGLGILGAAMAMLFVRLIGTCCLIGLTLWRTPVGLLGFREAQWSEFRFQLRPGLNAMAIPLSQVTLLQGLVLTVGWAAGPAAAGMFSVVRTICRLGLQATSIVIRAVWYDYTAAAEAGSVDRARKLVWLGFGLTLAICVPYTLGLAILGPLAIDIWTAGAITPGWSIVLVMASGVIAAGVWNAGLQFLAALNRLDGISIVLMLVAIAGLLASIPLANRFGALGGAFVFTAADITLAVAFLFVAQRRLVGFDRAVETVRELLRAAHVSIGAKSR